MSDQKDHLNAKHILAMLAFFGLLLFAAVQLMSATFSPSGYRVRPTRNDVASTQYEGKMFNEGDLARERAYYGSRDFVSFGLSPTTSASSNLYLTVSAGVAYVDGYYVQVTTATLISATANTTNYAFLELPTSSNLVTSIRYTVNTSGTAPSDHSLLLLSFTASTVSVTAAVDLRIFFPFNLARFKPIYYSSSGYITIPAGVTNVYVYGCAGGGGGGGGYQAAGASAGTAGGNTSVFNFTLVGGNFGQPGTSGFAGSGASKTVETTSGNNFYKSGNSWGGGGGYNYSGVSNVYGGTGGSSYWATRSINGGGNTAGLPPWDAPANTGLGGAGGGGASFGGGGGGGGECGWAYLTVTPQTVYEVTIGAGGTNGNGGGTGQPGGDGGSGFLYIEY